MTRTVFKFQLLQTFKMARAFKQNPLETMLKTKAEHGDLLYFPWPIKTLMVFHPDDIKFLVVTSSAQMRKGDQSDKLKAVIGNGLFSSEGPLWKERRRLINDVFHSKTIAEYTSLVEECLVAEMSKWPLGKKINLSEAISFLIFNISGRLFFGGVNAELAPKIKEAIEYLGGVLFKKISNPISLPYAVPTPTHLRFKTKKRFLDCTIKNWIQQRRKNPTDKPDFLNKILNADHSLTNEEIRDEAITLMIAGFETTSTLITWMFYLLAENSAYLKRLQDDPEGILLKAVFQESMRLYPPSPIISRQNTSPIEIGGKKFDTGTNFVFSQYITHRDERFWENPELFYPERFFKKEIHSGAYFPFSLGPRKCPGESLAFAEVQLIFNYLFKNFLIDLEKIELKPICEIILYPNRPLFATLQKK